MLSGHIDLLSREKISGWAWDSARPLTPVGLVIAVGGRVVARCLADRDRPDLVQAGFGEGRSGFDLVLAKPLSPFRAHEISLRREGDGAHLAGSPRTLPASTSLDAPTQLAIEQLVTNLAEFDVANSDVAEFDALEALAFLAAQTERLRDRLAERRSGAWERQKRRGLGWQEPLLGAGAAMPAPVSVPRALVIDDRVPATGRDAGSDAMLSHMRAMRRLGYDVTIAPASLHGDAAMLEAEGFATCLHPWYASIEDVLRRQAGAFQLVYLHRMANAARYLGLARQYQPGARLVYSVADLHFLRSARQGQIEARPELLRLSEHQRVAEFAAALQSDAVITHSTYEAELMRPHLPPGRVHVVPWSVTPRPTAVPFAARRGTAFIAHYAHQPNADAARILLERIMPEVWARDPAFPCLLAGTGMPTWLRCLTKAPAEALGAVPDLGTLFDRVRLTVAPLAYGAGIKGKVLTSLAAGVPCACTSIAAEGLDLPASLTELIADGPEALAAIMQRLETDEDFNARCAAAGLDYVAARLSEDAIDHALRGIIGRT